MVGEYNGRMTRIVLIVHLVSVFFLCTISIGFSSASVMEGVCLHLPKSLKDACVCEAIRPQESEEEEKSVSLVCKGLNSTRLFDFGQEKNEEEAGNNILGGNWNREKMRKRVQRIELKDCSRSLANQPVTEFALFENLRKLSIKRCGLTQESIFFLSFLLQNTMQIKLLFFFKQISLSEHPHLRDLDLSQNSLSDLTGLRDLDGLVSLNLSGNAISRIPEKMEDSFASLTHLDLSSNLLSNSIFPDLPTSLQAIYISSE